MRDGKPDSDGLRLAEGIMKHGIKLPEGMILKRSISRKLQLEEIDIAPGMVVADRALMSTSSGRIWYAQGRGGQELYLTVGKGVKGLPIQSIAKEKRETEVLLPPNQRVVITKVDGINIHGVILPTEDSQCCPP
jgi:hypothetical protein